MVGVDGKIREATALKICELTQKTPEFFVNENNFKTFSNATIDIDGNVCRLAISSAYNIQENNEFSKFYAQEMIEIIKIALDEISKFTFREKKYKINKQIFKIYWGLEALLSFHAYSDFTELKNVLINCSKLPEYTVREKCAKVLCFCKKDSDLEDLIKQLKSDENYYVRSVLENY